ncbi:MAG: ribonuclease P protein component [Armatimonadetes bacterium]|nr:ribonuclease P protein component [Armatimonadota bacterium]
MLPARARLTASTGFRTVYSRGRSYVSDLIVVYVLPRPGGSRFRFGFTAGKKIGGAVQRNRAKRLMREAARALIPRIAGSFDIVVVARHKINTAAFAEVKSMLEKLLTRAGVLAGTGD